MISSYVTTEKLRKKFKNNFELCNFAIHIGQAEIMSNSHATLGDILNLVDIKASEKLASQNG